MYAPRPDLHSTWWSRKLGKARLSRLTRPFGVGRPKRLAPDPLRTEPLTSNTTKSAGTKDEHLGHTVCPECTVLRLEGLYDKGSIWASEAKTVHNVILGPLRTVTGQSVVRDVGLYLRLHVPKIRWSCLA
jgi:hypothetical protein